MWTDLFRSWDLNIQSGTKYLKAENFINYVTGRPAGTDFNQTIIEPNTVQTSESVIQKVSSTSRQDWYSLTPILYNSSLYMAGSASKRLCDLPIPLTKSEMKPACQPPLLLSRLLSPFHAIITGLKKSWLPVPIPALAELHHPQPTFPHGTEGPGSSCNLWWRLCPCWFQW